MITTPTQTKIKVYNVFNERIETNIEDIEAVIPVLWDNNYLIQLRYSQDNVYLSSSKKDQPLIIKSKENAEQFIAEFLEVVNIIQELKVPNLDNKAALILENLSFCEELAHCREQIKEYIQ
jgi:hypothetical protein